MLASGQLSILTEMGIPVWELRLQGVSAELTASEVEFTDQLPAVDCLIVVAEHDHNDEAIRLLHAMLFSIDVLPNNSAIVSSQQLNQLSVSSDQHKLLIVFGEQRGPVNLSNQNNGQIQIANQITISSSLTTLLSSPAKKASAWQALQLVKTTYQADVIQQ